MRLFCPRASIRGLMIAVGLVGLSIAAHQDYQRLKPLSDNYSFQAEFFAAFAERNQFQAGRTREDYLEAKRRIDRWVARGITPRHGYPIEPELARELVSYHTLVAAKYRRAARFPWLPVEPGTAAPTGEPPIVTERQP